MNTILHESLVNFSQAAKLLPPHRGSRHCSPATIWRWVRDGVRLPNGQLLRLEAVRVGGHWLTSIEALDRFIQAQTVARLPDQDQLRAPPIRTPTQRRRASLRAAKQLEKLGL